jgi:hypothetical protein
MGSVSLVDAMLYMMKIDPVYGIVSHEQMTPTHIWLLRGYAGSGKDTAAMILSRLTGGTISSFASAVKDEVAGMYDFDRSVLDTQEGKQRRVHLADGTCKTLRDLLIQHGQGQKQETGDPQYWAKRLQVPNTTHWILSDWRFLAEWICLQARFPEAIFHTMQIVRDSVNPLDTETEHELDGVVCVVWPNNGTIQDLEQYIQDTVRSQRI